MAITGEPSPLPRPVVGMTARPCATCGEVIDAGTYCPEHTTYRTHTLSPSARGYDAAWSRLSRRARRLSRVCEDCGTTDDLTTDHSPEAWERRAAGREIRLDDVAVVCRSCNGKRGKARPNDDTTRRRPAPEGQVPPVKPQTELRMLLTSEEIR